MDHIIRKQLLELTLDGQQHPFDLQNRLNDHYYHALLPLLEKWFDRLSGEEEVVCIDRLEIDLGVFNGREFTEQNLVERLSRELDRPGVAGTADAQLIRSGGVAAADIPIQRRSVQQNAFEQWLWYMEKGFLPWSLRHPSNAWQDRVLETLATDYDAISRLRSILGTPSIAGARIVRQHDVLFLKRLVEILTAVNQSTLPPTLDELLRLLAGGYGSDRGTPIDPALAALSGANLTLRPVSPPPTPEQVWQDAIVLAATLGGEATPQHISQALLKRYGREESGYGTAAPKDFPPHPLPTPPDSAGAGSGLHSASGAQPASGPSASSGALASVGTPASAGIEKSTGGGKRETPASAEKQINRSGEQGRVEGASGQRVAMPGSPAQPPSPDGSTAASPEAAREERAGKAGREGRREDLSGGAFPEIPEEGLFVANAGTILVHPFLSPLFRRRGLIVDGQFIDAIQRQKAIHLLHYLATGHSFADEHELTAAKLFCGCPLEEPLGQLSPWSPEELTETDDLLEGLIGHWGVKGITKEGLRGNFLTRPGKFYGKNDRLYITVEKHAVDILIRTYPFPWNMSIIKLPWLGQAIHLDW
jgi:hypothetical protein